MKKVYDIVASVGSYTDRDGNDKKRYLNVGSVLKGDNGPFIVFKKWFNPAAIQGKDGDDSVFLSLFEPKDDEKPVPRRGREEESDDRPAKKRPAQRDTFEDDIPF